MMLNLNTSNRSFGWHIFVLKLFGLYKFDNYSEKLFNFYAWFCYVFFTLPVPILSSLQLIMSGEDDLAVICDNLFLIGEVGNLIIKLLPFKMRNKRVRHVIGLLDSEEFANCDEEDWGWIQDAVTVSRNLFRVFVGVCLCSWSTWVIRPFFSAQREFPIDIWLPFDPFNNTLLFYFVYAFIFYGTLQATLDNASVDTLVVGLIYHAAAQIKVLRNSLEHLDQRAEKTRKLNGLSQFEKEQILYENICKCIKHHDAIFYFVKEVEDTFSPTVFSQFASSIIVISVSCLNLSLVDPTSFSFVVMIIYILTILFQIFLFCIFGTILYEESILLTESIYKGNWYEFDIKSKRALITLMERSKRPMTLTAGKLLNLSLDTFTMIIRRAYSLLAVLKNY